MKPPLFPLPPVVFLTTSENPHNQLLPFYIGMSCCICLEDLNSPVSLPCGHVFCQECLRRAVQAVEAYSTLHACPTCRAHYFIAPLDLSSVPQYLRPHLTPSIRKVYIDLPSKSEKVAIPCSDVPPSETSHNLSVEIARIRAENDALRHNCLMWRKRAEVHSSATLGLLELSRTAKDQVAQVSRQRDSIRRDYLKLNHDYQRQKTILQAVMTAIPPPGLRPVRSKALMNQVISLHSVSTNSLTVPLAQACGSRPTDERHRKRSRTEDDGSDGGASPEALLCSRPAKIARQSETDSFNELDIAHDPQTVQIQASSETS